MDALCPACSCGPSHVEGHVDLLVRSLGNDGIAFKCRNCQSLWWRSYSGSGRFSWRRHSGPSPDVGVTVPPRSGECWETPHSAPMNTGLGAAEHWLAIQRSWKQPRRHPA